MSVGAAVEDSVISFFLHRLIEPTSSNEADALAWLQGFQCLIWVPIPPFPQGRGAGNVTGYIQGKREGGREGGREGRVCVCTMYYIPGSLPFGTMYMIGVSSLQLSGPLAREGQNSCTRNPACLRRRNGREMQDKTRLLNEQLLPTLGTQIVIQGLVMLRSY